MANRIEDDLHVAGTISAEGMAVPANSINNAALQSGQNFDAEKFEQQRNIAVDLSTHTADAATVRKVVHVVYGATGSLIEFAAGVTVAATSTGACTVDLLVNGASVLSSVITLDSTNAAFTGLEAGVISDTALVAGDVIEVAIASATGSTLPKGVHARVVLNELPQ